MKNKIILLIDAFINFVLGILLLAFSPGLIRFLGVPPTDNFFYPNILGAILFGIGIALTVEAYRKHKTRYIGLGLIGAISINMCGGLVLLFWLIFGGLHLPVKGQVFLWVLDILLIFVSLIELFADRKEHKEQN